MTEKFCPKCKNTFPVAQFGPNSSRRDGLQAACRKCMIEYRKDHYTNNKTPYLERAKAQKTLLRKMVADLKEAGTCADCQVWYPYYVMHYDHLGLEKKLAGVADLTGRGSKSKILEEIKKCDLVCANCHSARTYRRSKGV